LRVKTEKSAVQGLLWADHSTAAVTKLATPVGIRLGTSAFTAAGWPGTFYPEGLAPRDYLSYYAQKFDTVEVDSTFYRCPAASTVRRWYDKTPPEFIFSAKVPQSIAHEKHLLDCRAEMSEFVSTMELLQKKLGPLLLQFGYFSATVFRSIDEFLGLLAPCLDQLPRSHRYMVEIRNKDWLTPKFIDVLRQRGVALALIDQAWMPQWMNDPREWAERKLELITADFTYIRWLGDRKVIDVETQSWGKTVVDRRSELQKWVDACVVIRRRGVDIYAYANNHYAGHGPATLALFAELYAAKTGQEVGG
jgi:uncharacterized protein YecE (DUF72 family)